MIAYEVTAEVEAAIAPGYEHYMRTRHLADLLATGKFVAAELLKSGVGRFRQRYLAQSPADLDDYLNDHAPRLRDDFAKHFPTGVTISREVWQLVERQEA